MTQALQPTSAATPDLLRAARAVLDWSLVETSQRAGISVASVLAAEKLRIKPVSAVTLARLLRAYEDGGVLLFDDGPAGRGIRVHPR